MTTHRIAVVPGDGIGHEIIPVAWQVLEAALRGSDVTLQQQEFPYGAGYYRKHGRFLPEDGLAQLGQFDAILFGAVGLPDVDDTLPFKEFTNLVRVAFSQFANYRPCRTMPGVAGPLRSEQPFDFVIVRENNEGEFVLSGSQHHTDQPHGFATQQSVFTRYGIDRIARYSFELAATRRRKVTNVTKSNTLIHSLAYWDQVIEEVAAEYRDIEYERMYVDNAAASMVLRPHHFDVMLSTNMMGDILSDLGGALMGSLGLGGSGNINPTREKPSMFEPIHGSAPDIAGQGIANPIGAIESAAIMIQHLGHADAATKMRKAVVAVLQDGLATKDLGGSATTRQVGDAVIERLESIAEM